MPTEIAPMTRSSFSSLSPLQSAYVAIAEKRDLRFEYSGFTQSQKPYTALMRQDFVAMHYPKDGEFSGIIEEEDAVILIDVHSSGVTIKAAAKTLDVAQDAYRRQTLLIPEWTDPKSGQIRVGFWAWNGNGPVMRWRTLTTADPRDIDKNYTKPVQDGIQDLLKIKEPANLGHLILFHGVPGTGKTYFIRMLAEHWKPWCETHYIIDPDAMLQNGAYLSAVIFSEDQEWDDAEPAPFNFRSEPREKWKLIVIEDASEFIEKTAKDRTGQGLQRLLNLADGLIGQSTNTLVLITTNEPLDALHPAITRAGRCLANIEFPQLPKEQANEWLKEKGVDEQVSRETTLAELYEKLGQARIGAGQSVKRAIGFGK